MFQRLHKFRSMHRYNAEFVGHHNLPPPETIDQEVRPAIDRVSARRTNRQLVVDNSLLTGKQ